MGMASILPKRCSVTCPFNQHLEYHHLHLHHSQYAPSTLNARLWFGSMLENVRNKIERNENKSRQLRMDLLRLYFQTSKSRKSISYIICDWDKLLQSLRSEETCLFFIFVWLFARTIPPNGKQTEKQTQDYICTHSIWCSLSFLWQLTKCKTIRHSIVLWCGVYLARYSRYLCAVLCYIFPVCSLTIAYSPIFS